MHPMISAKRDQIINACKQFDCRASRYLRISGARHRLRSRSKRRRFPDRLQTQRQNRPLPRPRRGPRAHSRPQSRSYRSPTPSKPAGITSAGAASSNTQNQSMSRDDGLVLDIGLAAEDAQSFVQSMNLKPSKPADCIKTQSYDH